MNKYDEWRANGHSPLIAFMGTVPIGPFFAVSIGIGIVIGLFL